MLNYTELLDVIIFATQKHKKQQRKGSSNTPYIVHPMQVAKILLEIGKIEDINIIKAAILHDTIEDTDTNPEEITELFGETVKNIVLEVTDDKSLPKQERKELQVEKMSQKSMEAQTLKIADKICNLTDLINDPPKNWKISRILEYVDWAEKVVNKAQNINPNLESYFAQKVKEAREMYNHTNNYMLHRKVGS